jgi:hypothetical protein
MRILCTALTFFGLLYPCTTLHAADFADSMEKEAEMVLAWEQQTRLEDIRKEFSPKIAIAGRDLSTLVKEEVTKIQTVLTQAQNEKLQALKLEPLDHKVEGLAQRLANLEILDLTQGELAKVGQIRNAYRPKIENTLKELDSILSQEQTKSRADAINAGKKGTQVMANLKLTDAQKEKVAAVGKKVSSLVKEELEMLRDILSPDQKVLLLTLKDESLDQVRDRLAQKIASLKDLNLSDEQKTAIARIRNEYRPRIHGAGNNLRALIRQEVTMIAAVFKG